jgi:hypothetical protein
MLTENQISDCPRAIMTALGPPATSARSPRGYASGLAPFFAVVAQFALIVMVVSYWQLESQPLARLMWLAFVGFVIHHLLPLRFRLPFFAMLSLLAVITGVGHVGLNVWTAWLTGKLTTGVFLYYLLPGLTLIGIGLGLIAICHLPIRSKFSNAH